MEAFIRREQARSLHVRGGETWKPESEADAAFDVFCGRHVGAGGASRAKSEAFGP